MTLVTLLGVTTVLAMNLTPVVGIGTDPTTGAWNSIVLAGKSYGTAYQDVDIRWRGGRLPPAEEWRLLSASRSGPTTRVVRQAGPWELTTETTVAGQEIVRRLSARWRGDGTAVVTGASLRTPQLRFSQDMWDRVMIPGDFPPRELSARQMAVGSAIREIGWTRAEYGLAFVRAPGNGPAVLAGYRFREDEARVAVLRTSEGVVLEHSFLALAKVGPGEQVHIGEQVLRVLTGGLADVRREMAVLANRLGNGPPRDHPEDIGRIVLYEAHPWGRLESWPQGDRGNRFDRLTRLLPYYRQLGVTALWLLPVSWPPPWVYTLPAWDRIAPDNGTPEQLRDLVRTAHARGMRVLLDLVVYGIHPEAEVVSKLPPDVWCYDEEGRPTRVWGGTVLAADTSNPVWQERIREVVSAWARDYGFDGTRLDCIGWGQAPNWRLARPNAAITAGGLELNRLIRDAFRRVRPQAVTLPEGGKPLVFRHADMVFDYPLYLAMRDLTVTPDLARWVSDVKTWLEWERHAYPKRALRGMVRFLENHDTVSATEYFGVGPSQSLMSAIVFMQGVPLIYQEQEIGFSEDLAAWLSLRHRERCFTHGDARYEAVRSSDPRVLTFLREADDGAAVVAVNLTGEPARVRLSWPRDVARRFPAVWDGLTGKAVTASGSASVVAVPPYRPVVLLLKRSAWRPPARARAASSGERWTVRTREGVLTDFRRDYATRLRPGEKLEDALPTLRRALRAEELGLMDGAVPPELQRGPVRVRVNPWFVVMVNDRLRLTLARRHGGIPVALEPVSGKGSPALLAGGDAYADQGFFPDRLYGSVDGETNPRLWIASEGQSGIVEFRGVLRRRSWNGVQTCATADPVVTYALRYEMGPDTGVTLTMELRPSRDRPEGPYFFGMRLPLRGCIGWQRGDGAGEAGAHVNERVGSEGSQTEPLILNGSGASLVVRPGDGLERLFAVETGDGVWQLFLALADGGRPGIRAGEVLSARAELSFVRSAP